MEAVSWQKSEKTICLSKGAIFSQQCVCMCVCARTRVHVYVNGISSHSSYIFQYFRAVGHAVYFISSIQGEFD